MSALESEVVTSAVPPVYTNFLTIKQKAFIRHYIETRNGRLAAELAGYAGNEQTLAVQASENLRKPNIRAEFTRLLNPIADAEEIVARLTKYSRASLADVLNDNGEFDLAWAKENLSDDLIRKLKFDKDTGKVVEVEIHDAKDATVQLAKVHRLLSERVEVTDKTPDNTDTLTALKTIAKQISGVDLSDEQVKSLLEQSFKRAELGP